MPDGNVTVEAVFELKPYSLTINPAEGGTLSASVSNPVMGTTVTITPAPQTGYKIGKVIWNDGGNHEITASPFSFTMPASDVTVSAVFAKIDYTVSIAPGLVNGSLSLDKTSAQIGDMVTVTVNPAPAYRLRANSLTFSGTGYSSVGITLGGPTVYTFIMVPAHLTVSAQFEKIPGLNVTFAGFGPQTVNLAASKDDLVKEHNDVLTVTVTPQAGQTVAGWTLDGEFIITPDKTPYSGNSREFRALDLSEGIHRVSVAVSTSGGTPYSNEVSFRVTGAEIPAGLNIMFTGFGNESINLASSGETMSKADNDTLTVTLSLQEGQTVAGWTLDGDFILEGENPYTGNSRQFRALDLSVGEHHVTAALTQGGTPYSKEIIFTVSE
jgi:hypothetical protein